MTEGRERVSRLARLRHEYRQTFGVEWCFAVAKFGSDVDTSRNTGIAFDPVFANQTGKISRAAGDQNHPLDGRQINVIFRQSHAAIFRISILPERARQHLRLLVNFLAHEVPVIAFVHHGRRGIDHHLFACDARPVGSENLRTRIGNNRPVAIIKISNAIGEGRKRESVRTDEHFTASVTHRQRAAIARYYHTVFQSLDNQSDRISSIKRGEGGRGGCHHIVFCPQILRKQMRDDFCIRVGGKFSATRHQVLFEVAVVFNNAIMHHRNLFRPVRMRVGLDRRAVGGPSCMADAHTSRQRRGFQLVSQCIQLAFGAAALQLAAGQRGDTRTVVTAIFEPLEPVKYWTGDLLVADDTDNAAHGSVGLLIFTPE